MNTLVELQNNYKFNTDKNSVHTYLKYYDELFFPLKDKKIKILEIGVLYGGSIMLWNKYFTDCTIFGMDTNYSRVTHPEIWEYDNVFLTLKDVDSLSDNSFGDMKFDIIIDDGSHSIPHQEKSMKIFKNKLSKGGILIIEDISTKHNNLNYFKNINNEGFKILDLRNENGIEDNILIIYKNE